MESGFNSPTHTHSISSHHPNHSNWNPRYEDGFKGLWFYPCPRCGFPFFYLTTMFGQGHLQKHEDLFCFDIDKIKGRIVKEGERIEVCANCGNPNMEALSPESMVKWI